MTRGGSGEAFGPYIVYEQLGAGGMAEVHRAEQAGIEGFRKVVALKRMLPHMAANDDMVRAFVREARLASYLRHANVAQTFELGKVDDTYFIAMELIEGRSLRDVLRRCASLEKVMPVSHSLNVLNQICDALDYAHNLRDHEGTPLGIIHRDVSPSNVIVASDGVVKLIDFGIAKASAAGMQTMSGAIKGKFGYMAPEYLNGMLDARADLFALGVIAHELLTNRPLFTTGDDIETLERVRAMQILPPSRKNPNVPPEIDDVVMTALERDPEKRWQHATALRTALTTLTQRLGLQVTNQEVVAWLDELDYDAKTLPTEIALGDGESVVISVEQAFTAAPMTVQLKGSAVPPPSMIPVGTPAHTITAQRSIQPSHPPKELATGDAEYAAAVARYERHQGIQPSEGMFADEVIPTQVRTSSPRIQPPPLSDDPVRAALPTVVEMPASAVAAAVAERLSARQAAVAPNPPAKRSKARILVLLVLLATGAAVGLYFLLPYLT